MGRRNTKKTKRVESIERTFPLSQDLDMLRLRKIVDELPEDRRKLLEDDPTEGQGIHHGETITED
jgi:hypothetical protein